MVITERERASGVLLPISSLPSPYGVGTLGKEAYAFVDWLTSAGAKVWQILPLLPTGYGDSPYQSVANNALNHYFIDLDALCADGLLLKEECDGVCWGEDARRVDYSRLFENRVGVLKVAFSRFDKANKEWLEFCAVGKYYDYALFMTIKSNNGYRAWNEWPNGLRGCDGTAVEAFAKAHDEEIDFWQWTQFVFLGQWKKLKSYANGKGVKIMGDLPIYVSMDSVEMWKYRKELFLLDEDLNPALQAGVPPDAFCDDGQLWGNPVYNWEIMREKGYLWWKNRIDYNLSLFDIVRIDHFRGFDRFFAVPIGDETARNGEWLQGPGAELFVGREKCDIVAEDLGVIDDGVIEMMEKTGYPGMKVVEFGLDGNPENWHKPSQHKQNCVAYSGTHDNEPFMAYVGGLDEWGRKVVVEDLKRECELLGVEYSGDSDEEICSTVVRLLYASKAYLCVVPMHDVLLKGGEARLNFPSTVSLNNWSYRYKKEEFTKESARWLKALAQKNDR